jgi:hypothetical protein
MTLKTFFDRELAARTRNEELSGFTTPAAHAAQPDLTHRHSPKRALTVRLTHSVVRPLNS